jgi:OOP family OmpA-OmpF porin
MRIRLTPIASALSAMSAVAAAQDGTTVRTTESLVSRDYVSVLGGYFIPDKGYGAQRNGSALSLIYGDQFSDNWSVEGNLFGTVLETGRNNGTDYYQTGATLDAVYGLYDRTKATITPFVVGGGGAEWNDMYPQQRSRTSFVADGGLGFVTKSLYHGIKIRGEGRYLHNFFEGGQNDFRVQLGIEIPLGRVIDRIIEVPTPAPPAITEIKEVPRPWIDSDGDGVDDEHDDCPNTPHGLKVDAHGCVIPGQVIQLNGVTFDFNKARLTANAQTILNTISAAFIGQPSLKVEIAGHTDSIGTVAANLKLSQARADAVKAYLISRGAKPQQLAAKGYGKSQPLIHPEKTADDREHNRRVEFRVLDK